MRNQPEPPVKWKIRDLLLNAVYAQVRKERDAKLGELVGRNQAALLKQDADEMRIVPGHTHPSFAFNGEFYNLSWQSGPAVRNPVHPSLVSEVRAFVDYYDRQILKEEQLRVSGFFDSVLSFSECPADWLAVLPYCMQNILRSNVLASDWTTRQRSDEQVQAFIEKHKPRYELVKQRMAMNLIT